MHACAPFTSSVCRARPQPLPSFPQVLKVAILAEKYAVDYTWYVDTILNLIRIAGDYVSEEVWYRVIQIVINRDDVQGYAAKTVFEVGMKSAHIIRPFTANMFMWTKWELATTGYTMGESELREVCDFFCGVSTLMPSCYVNTCRHYRLLPAMRTW